jgi:hypothetical protein
MSTLKTDNIVNVAGNGPPTLTNGVNVTGSVAATTVTASGVITGSSFAGSGANLTGISSEPFKPVSLAGATYVVTVASVDSVNKFHIGGVPNPTLNFSKANVYIFDLSDSSNAGHPLVFKTSGSVAYTTGVVVTGTAGQAGAKVTITVAASAPAALLYSCSAHGNAMGNTIAVAAAGAMDLGTFNYFDNGTLTANTTVSFASVPTNAKWSYSFVPTSLNKYDVSQAVLLNSFDTTGRENSSRSIYFKPDGSKMYVAGDQGQDVNEYNLPTAWDVTTAVYYQNWNFGGAVSGPNGLSFKPDGTRMYVLESDSKLRQWTLSTPWNVTSAGSLVNKSLSAQELYGSGVFFRADGLKVYATGYNSDNVNEYNLSTAWEISTVVYSQSFSFASQDNAPTGLYFKSDGLKMYMTGFTNKSIFQYTLSTAWDISTATYVSAISINTFTTSPQNIFIREDGIKMYLVSNAAGTEGVIGVGEYDIGITTSITLPAAIQNTPSAKLVPAKRTTYDFFTMDGGTTVNVIGEEIV